MYQALYRKYRPQTFDDVVGQLAVTQTLKTQLVSNKLSHAYLFTGSRGTGKTTSAKILAKAVNCVDPVDGNPCNCCEACRSIDAGSCMDVLEIDAASNNGVDNVRDLRDDAVYSPSQVKKRVYIIDEVHMLSLSAFNALLKIIEEPPEHLLFILATTELHKVPATILSRCQRFSFRRISQENIASRLQYVAYQERIELDESAARVLARLADGGLRDGLTLLDQCASAISGELTAEKVYACLGIAGTQKCAEIMGCIARQDASTALKLLNQLYADGKDMGALLDEMTCLARDLMVLKTSPNAGITMLSGVATDEDALRLCQTLSSGELNRIMLTIQRTVSAMGRSASRRMDAELCLITLCQPELELDNEALLARLTRVEDQLKAGSFVMQAVAPEKASEEGAVDALQKDPIPEKTVLRADELPLVDTMENEAPVGFWADVAASVRAEVNTPVAGFLSASEDSPVRGILQGDRLLLVCTNPFTLEIINRPEILRIVALKASAKLGRQVRVALTDRSGRNVQNANMEELLEFGRAHSDKIDITDNEE